MEKKYYLVTTGVGNIIRTIIVTSIEIEGPFIKAEKVAEACFNRDEFQRDYEPTEVILTQPLFCEELLDFELPRDSEFQIE